MDNHWDAMVRKTSQTRWRYVCNLRSALCAIHLEHLWTQIQHTLQSKATLMATTLKERITERTLPYMPLVHKQSNSQFFCG